MSNPAAAIAEADRSRAAGNLGDAIEILADAAERFPLTGPILASLIPDAAAALRWDLAADAVNRAVWLEESRPAGATYPAIMPFTALTVDLDPHYQRRLAELYVRRVFPPTAPRPAAVDHGGPVRIGYLSADIRDHPVMHLGASLFENHDRSRFEVLCFSTAPPDDSTFRHRVIAAADQFIDLHDVADPEAVRLLHAARLDVLVDLSGHTRFARFGLLASRPAALQLHYLGFPGSTGASFIDAYVGDPIATPDPTHFTERLLNLPRCYQINEALAPVDDPPARSDLGLPEHGPVLCSFASTYKLEPLIVGIWAEILAQVPDAVLWLLDPGPEPARVLRAAIAPFADPDRIVFAPRLTRTEHLQRLALADIALDTYFVGGHTTTSDALRAGVPVVTCPRDPMISRVSASLLYDLGLDELVTHDLDAYRRLVVELTGDRPRRESIRRQLCLNRDRGALFDPTDAVDALEDLILTTRERTTNHVVA